MSLENFKKGNCKTIKFEIWSILTETDFYCLSIFFSMHKYLFLKNIVIFINIVLGVRENMLIKSCAKTSCSIPY